MTFWMWIRTNTQGVTEAARQVLYMLLGFEVLKNARGETWTDAQTALALSALSAILALVAAKTNVASVKVERREEVAHAAGVAVGEASTGSGRRGTGH